MLLHWLVLALHNLLARRCLLGRFALLLLCRGLLAALVGFAELLGLLGHWKWPQVSSLFTGDCHVMATAEAQEHELVPVLPHLVHDGRVAPEPGKDLLTDACVVGNLRFQGALDAWVTRALVAVTMRVEGVHHVVLGHRQARFTLAGLHEGARLSHTKRFKLG